MTSAHSERISSSVSMRMVSESQLDDIYDAALTVLEKTEELELHLQAALNVGCKPRELAEVIFQTAVYGGVPAMNQGLQTLRKVLQEQGLWPIPDED